MLNALSNLMEVSLFISMLLVFIFTTIFTKSGAFEVMARDEKCVRRYSLILILFAVLCVGWAYYFKGSTMMAGTVPFVFLVILKVFLQRKMLLYRV